MEILIRYGLDGRVNLSSLAIQIEQGYVQVSSQWSDDDFDITMSEPDYNTLMSEIILPHELRRYTYE